ncbi:MAG: YqhA family protein [Ruminococcaceae bacterium]|nr:YqhA family protein [Oscillospiraceae bacterium]
MKTARYILIISSIFSFLLSMVCFIKALMCELDAYDFGRIYSYLNPSKIFLLTAIVLLMVMFLLSKKDETELKIEKVFAVIFVIIAIGFASGYISGNFGNNPFFSKAYNSQTQNAKQNVAYDLHKRYLPFYDEYSDGTENTGAYEIYKSDLKNTVMVYVDSDIINSEFSMYYELEFLNTENILIYTKFLLERLYFDKTSVVELGNKSTYSVGSHQVNICKYNSDYVAYIQEDNNFMYITLSNATIIDENELVDTCVEQYDLMKETLDNGRLLVIPQ